jgi:hypothetical protein
MPKYVVGTGGAGGLKRIGCAASIDEIEINAAMEKINANTIIVFSFCACILLLAVLEYRLKY